MLTTTWYQDQEKARVEWTTAWKWTTAWEWKTTILVEREARREERRAESEARRVEIEAKRVEIGRAHV